LSQLRLGRRAPAGVVPELPLSGDGDRLRLQLREREPKVARLPRPRGRGLVQPLPLAGFLLVLVALIGYLAVYSRATKRTAVLVSARDLPAGTILRAPDLRSAGLAGDGAVLGSLVPARQLRLVVGRRITARVARGLPLPSVALVTRARVPSAFTVAVPVQHALGGELQPGDRVSVLATFQSPTGGARTRAIARGLEVLAVGQPPAGFAQSSATIPVTLALPDPSLASVLALASEAGKIDLLREGTRASAPIPPASVGGMR
jgi:Flp pilus assembly protein CpaB